VLSSSVTPGTQWTGCEKINSWRGGGVSEFGQAVLAQRAAAAPAVVPGGWEPVGGKESTHVFGR
jgi:hypothetical protein